MPSSVAMIGYPGEGIEVIRTLHDGAHAADGWLPAMGGGPRAGCRINMRFRRHAVANRPFFHCSSLPPMHPMIVPALHIMLCSACPGKGCRLTFQRETHWFPTQSTAPDVQVGRCGTSTHASHSSGDEVPIT